MSKLRKHGPSPVTATALHLIKGVACKILNIPQSRSLVRPKFILTPNRGKFSLMNEGLPTSESLVDLRQRLDKEVNRYIRKDISIKQYNNMTLTQLLNIFGGDVIDRYYDLTESKFVDWLFKHYQYILGKPIWNNKWESFGPLLYRNRYQYIDGIEIDKKEAILKFLDEIGGNPLDLMHEKTLVKLQEKKEYMKLTNQYEREREMYNDDIQTVFKREWTHKFGIFDKITNTNYDNAIHTLMFSAIEFGDKNDIDNDDELYFNGLSLPNSGSYHLNSQNIIYPCNYLKSSGELGKIVITQLRYKTKYKELKIYFDVFPGYESEIIGPNPYIMFRDTFNVQNLASLIPVDHDLKIPSLTTPLDMKNKQID